MSYCRFENTSSDLFDCVGAVQDAVEEGMTLKQFEASLSSEYERAGFRRMLRLCQEFAQAVEEMEAQEEGELFDNEMDA
jgi:hypothetical protein